MPDLSTYTTSDLERLTTLTLVTTQPGEYVRHCDVTTYLKIVACNGKDLVRQNGDLASSQFTSTLVRRVRSFTDLTELDPPVDVMWAELARRNLMKQAADAFAIGDRVRYGHGIYTVGQKRTDAYGVTTLTLETGNQGQSGVDPHMVEKVVVPQPIVGQVYRHRETTDAKPFDKATPSPYTNWFLMRYDGDNRWSSQSITRRGQWGNYGTSSPMTAAVQKGEWVPYVPPVISNATHAGRRVRHSTLGDGRVVDSKNAARWIKGLGIIYDGVVVAFDNGSMDGFSHERFTLLD